MLNQHHYTVPLAVGLADGDGHHEHCDCLAGALWFSRNRTTTFVCVVAEKHQFKQSIRLTVDGREAGWCACYGLKFESVQLGDVVLVAALRRYISGKFCQPRWVTTLGRARC